MLAKEFVYCAGEHRLIFIFFLVKENLKISMDVDRNVSASAPLQTGGHGGAAAVSTAANAVGVQSQSNSFAQYARARQHDPSANLSFNSGGAGDSASSMWSLQTDRTGGVVRGDDTAAAAATAAHPAARKDFHRFAPTIPSKARPARNHGGGTLPPNQVAGASFGASMGAGAGASSGADAGVAGAGDAIVRGPGAGGGGIGGGNWLTGSAF